MAGTGRPAWSRVVTVKVTDAPGSYRSASVVKPDAESRSAVWKAAVKLGLSTYPEP